MAHVAMSKELVNYVANKVSQLYDDQAKAAKTPIPTAWFDELYDILFDKSLQYRMDALPDGVMPKSAGIDIIVDNIQIKLLSSTERSMPREGYITGLTHIIGRKGYWGHELRDDYLPAQPLLAKIRARQSEINRVEADRKKAVSEAERFLNQHTSLKSALKDWPMLWDLLPENTRQRHREVAVKKTPVKAPKPEPVQTDLSEITALTALSKMRDAAGKMKG